jgi:predicted Fe-Mo cluster-binding NifX family protein
MKIAISTVGETIDSHVEPRFGRCPFLLIQDTTEETTQIYRNPAKWLMHGAGINAAKKLLDVGVEVVLTGNLGPKAFKILMEGGIKAFRAKSGDVNQAIQQYQKGELSPITSVGPKHPGLSARGNGGVND